MVIKHIIAYRGEAHIRVGLGHLQDINREEAAVQDSCIQSRFPPSRKRMGKIPMQSPTETLLHIAQLN